MIRTKTSSVFHNEVTVSKGSYSHFVNLPTLSADEAYMASVVQRDEHGM